MKLLTLPIMTAAIAFAACSQAAEPTTKLAAEPAAKASMERIGNWLVFKEDAVDEASVTATIYISSVFAGDKERDAALPGKEWFDVKKFPKAVFQSDDFVKTSNGQYEARGTLSMKGKSQPLTLPFTLDIDGARAEMEGKVTVVDVKIVAKSPF